MPKLPLPDTYLVDSRKLIAEVDRIRNLALAVPTTANSHSAIRSVIDAAWHLRRDLEDILRVQAAIHASFVKKGEELPPESEPVRIGLRNM
jgi:hypothetical protein